MPGFRALPRPFPKHSVRRPQFALFDDRSVGNLDAVADTFLVNVESDIVIDVHWVLLIEVSEPVRKNRSRQHCTLQENPTTPYLYIQTGGQPAAGWQPAPRHLLVVIVLGLRPRDVVRLPAQRAPRRGSDRRWYEKAGLPRDAVSSRIDALDQVQEGDRL